MGRLLKKGQVEDQFYMIVMLLALGIGAVVATYAVNQWVDMAENTTAFADSPYNNSIMTSFRSAQTINGMWDYVIVAVLMGFAIAVIILGYFVDVHSAFFVLYVLGLMVGVGVAVILTSVWDSVVAATQFATIVSTDFPITDHIMSNLAIYMTIVGALSMIALYAKTRANEVRQ